ncbi:hypothetical protein KO489_06635 [Reinekea forsetii]|nr:hypothetical protein [Reinekea forsetii]
MFIDGLSDWEKRRLALVLKDQGHTAFMVIKHAKAAALSAQRNRPVNDVDRKYLALLDETVEALYGYKRMPNTLEYATPETVAAAVGENNRRGN